MGTEGGKVGKETLVKETKNSRIDNLGDYAKKGGPGRPKGAISLKTKVFNEILETWGDVKGKDKLKVFAKNSKNFPKYLNHIVALVKGNDDSIGSRFTNINIIDKSGLIQELRSEYPIRPGTEAERVPQP